MTRFIEVKDYDGLNLVLNVASIIWFSPTDDKQTLISIDNTMVPIILDISYDDLKKELLGIVGQHAA